MLGSEARSTPLGERLAVAVIMVVVAALLLIGAAPAVGWAWLP